MAEKSKREQFETLRSQLDLDRSSFISHWRDLGDFILPRRPRFLMTDANRGERKNQKIIDSTATLAARTTRSGMMGGITSPARPWFRLTTPDPALSELSNIKSWLSAVSERMVTVFLRSNLYNTLPIVYGDLSVFGTSAMLIEEDFTGDVIRTYAFPIGSYMIANDDLYRVRVFLRDFRMTVRQIVDKFAAKDDKGNIDFSNISDHVATQYQRGQYEAWVDVCHVITPNPDYRQNSLLSKYKRFASCYYERGSSGSTSANYMSGGDSAKILRESGYDYFPVLCPRWEVTGEDVYGTDCPGMVALGDIKQLQTGEKRSMNAIDKMVNPPMVGPTSLKRSRPTILPGDITFSDEREGQKGFRPAHEVNPRIAELEAKQEQVRERIRRAFYEDLFLMLSTSDRRQITAREIEERHEEKLLALGPVLEQLNQDLLDPLIDITFDIMVKQGMIPEPPEELQGVDLKVEYISVMAQAQKLVGVSGLERFASMVGQIAQFKPDALDKVDADQFVDIYGEHLGVHPSIIRSDDDVAEVREARAEAQQAQMAMENARQITGAVKDLSQSNTENPSALKEMMQMANAGNLVPNATN